MITPVALEAFDFPYTTCTIAVRMIDSVDARILTVLNLMNCTVGKIGSATRDTG